MAIASRIEAYPNLIQMAYQAVRLLTSDIRPEEGTSEGEKSATLIPFSEYVGTITDGYERNGKG